jgi:aryl carrier-like protein
LSPDSSKLSLTIVAQGSVIDQSQASDLLAQVQRSLLEILESAGRNIVSNNGFSKGQRDNLITNAKSTSSVLSGGAFTWTKESKNIRAEIARLANVDEGSVHEHSSIFELGLDSIDFIKLASRLKKRGVEIPVSVILKSQTIAKMATNIVSDGSGSKPPNVKSLLDMRRGLERYLESTGRLPDNVEAVLPATPLQQSMVNEMINSNFERYFNVDGFKLNKDVDLGKLMEAVKRVVDNSPILRTNFVTIDDPKLSVSYAQIVYNSLPHLDNAAIFSRLDESHSFESFMEHFKHASISLAKESDQLLQIRAVSASDSSYLVIAISHALYDGTSLRSIHEDIQRAYNGCLQNRPDFMPFLEEVFQSTTDYAKKFWRTTLSDLPSAKFPRKNLSDDEDSESSTRLERRSRVSLQAIEELCKSSRITLQTLGQTCWALVLSQLMGQLDIVFGSVLSCRDSEEAAEVMFPLMNTVAVRSVIHGSLSEMLQYMQDMSDTSRQYRHFPLGTAQAYALASRKNKNPNGDTTLFDTLFIYQGRRSAVGAAPLYESVYGVSDVEFPVCVEMEIVDDEYLSWTTKCKSNARNVVETEGILDSLESVLERIISASQEQAMISEADGVSVCGLPKFQIKDSKPRITPIKIPNDVEEKWSQTELTIRKALHLISDVPEESIRKDTTIFHLGLDSILVLKLPALLKVHGIKLSVSNILRDQTVYAMAKSAQGSATETEAIFDVDAEILRAISSFDLGDKLAKLEKEIGEVQYAMPVTAGQLYMIRQWQASRGSMFYQTFTYSMLNPINRANLEAAWSQLSERHDILRTGFLDVGSNVVQVVFKEPKNEVIYHTGKGNVVTRKQKANLKEPALSLVVEDAEGSSVTLKLVLHHVLYDGVSLPILIDELQALYHGQKLKPLPLSFKDFVAHSVAALPSAKEKWVTYLGEETLCSTKAVGGDTSMKRTEVFHQSIPITDVKRLSQDIGVSVDALFLAAISKIHAQNFQDGEATKPIPQVVFGIYLANRAPFGEDLSLLAAPTLNLLPVRVKWPLEKGIAEIAKDIQADIHMISAPNMVSASLAEIYEWTGVRVNSFVNILKSLNPGIGFNVVPRAISEWNAIQDLSRRAEIVDGVINVKMVVPEDGMCEAYLVSAFLLSG